MGMNLNLDNQPELGEIFVFNLQQMSKGDDV